MRGLFWGGVLLALVAIAGGGTVAYRSYDATSGPDGAVKGYFAALARSDAPAALAYGDLPAGPRELLTGPVLAEQQRLAPIRAVTVLATARHGRTATVTARYTLGFGGGAQQIDDTVRLHRSGASWRLDQVAVPVRLGLDEASERATIAGAPLPAGDTLLFPGAVPVVFDTPYLQLGAAARSVGLGTGVVHLTVAVSPAGRNAVAQALSAALAQCLAAPADPRCPVPSDRAVPGSLSGRIRGPIADGLKVSVGASAAGRIDIGGSVSVTGSYRLLDFDNVASSRHGAVSLPISASAYAVPPLQLRWEAGP